MFYILLKKTIMSATDPKKAEKPEPGTNNPDEVINTPGEVQESNDEKIDEDFPGYPHYPAEEDILNPENNDKKVDIDVENLTRSHTITPDHLKSIKGIPEIQPDFTVATEDEPDDIQMVSGTDADVTAEDLLILGSVDEDMDLGENEELKAQGWEPMTGRDLDVPDADLADDDSLAEDDEENSYYSLGGDEMEKLEENNDQNNF